MKNWTKTASITVCTFSWIASTSELLGQTHQISSAPSGDVRHSFRDQSASSERQVSTPLSATPDSGRSYVGWVASQQRVPELGVIARPDEQLKTAASPDDSVRYVSFFQTQGFGELPSNLPPPLLDTQVATGPAAVQQYPNQPYPNQPYPNQPYPSEQHPSNQYTGDQLVNVQFANAERPTAGLRQRNDGEAGGLSSQVLPSPQAQQFTTGLPYVTPAPGRYPTSPYMGPRNAQFYQTVGYQRAMPVSGSNQPTGTFATAQLPQYQSLPNQAPTFGPNPAPGIYQTAYQQCQVLPPPSLPPDGAIGQSYVPPTITPNLNPGMYSANNQGYRPLFSLGQENYNVVLGRGIIGQPTVYVPGQYVRNFLRYLSP